MFCRFLSLMLAASTCLANVGGLCLCASGPNERPGEESKQACCAYPQATDRGCECCCGKSECGCSPGICRCHEKHASRKPAAPPPTTQRSFDPVTVISQNGPSPVHL